MTEWEGNLTFCSSESDSNPKIVLAVVKDHDSLRVSSIHSKYLCVKAETTWKEKSTEEARLVQRLEISIMR